MRWQLRAVDAAVAVLVLAGTLVMLGSGGFGTSVPPARPLDGLGALLAAAAALPLAVHRVAPLGAYLAVAAASVTLLGLRYPLDVPLGAAVGAYALAVIASGDPRAWRRWAAAAAVAGFVPAVAVVYAAVGVELAGIAMELSAWAVAFGGAWLTGDRTRLRRERIADLEERTRRAEREVEREGRLAAAEERTRIARELHDSAGHAITVILVQAGAARLLHERDPARSLRAIGTIEDVARDTIGEIDRLVRALREDEGPQPPPAGPAVLAELLDRHRAGGLRVTADVALPDRALPPSLSWAVYRILQEALTNAARHGPGTAAVEVRSAGDAVEVTVTNPVAAAGGTGTAPDGGGHGIVGMRERASLLGGSFHAERGDGLFRVHARLPDGAPAPAGADPVAAAGPPPP